jgi:hypothetical protein
VGDVGDDRQAVLGHVLAVPARVSEPAAEQLIELHLVLGTDHVGVAERQHHGHLQLRDVRGPVVLLPHEVAHRVEQAWKVVDLRRHRLVGLVQRRLRHHRRHRGAHLFLLDRHLGVPAVVRIRRRHQHQPAHPVRVLGRQAQRDAAPEGIPEHVDLRLPELLQERIDVVGDRLAPDRPAAQRRAAVPL